MQQRNRFIYIAIILFSVFTGAVSAEEIGKVILTQGAPLVERSGQHLFIKRNSPLYTSDTLITPVGSKILFRLKDKTTISLAENSEFELSRYEFNKEKSDVSFKMLKGAFRTLTGSIGKQKDPKFEIHTPVATIGVRGTEFWGGLIFSEALDVTMLKGKGVYIKNDYGQVEIINPGDGTKVFPGQPPEPVSQWTKKMLKKAAKATKVKEPSKSHSFY